MAKGWKRTKTPEDVRARVLEAVPVGSERADVEVWLNDEGIPFSDEGDAVRMTLKGPSRGLWVGIKWLVAIRFEDGRLAAVDVDEGRVGP